MKTHVESTSILEKYVINLFICQKASASWNPKEWIKRKLVDEAVFLSGLT